MYQAPAFVWNQIAETQSLETEWAKRMFPLDAEEMHEALEAETAELKEKGFKPAIIASFHKMAPLLWEKMAVAAFVEDHPNLMGALPNVETVGEAVEIARRDYRMDDEAAHQLAVLLRGNSYLTSKPKTSSKAVFAVVARMTDRLAGDANEIEKRHLQEMATKLRENAVAKLAEPDADDGLDGLFDDILNGIENKETDDVSRPSGRNFLTPFQRRRALDGAKKLVAEQGPVLTEDIVWTPPESTMGLGTVRVKLGPDQDLTRLHYQGALENRINKMIQTAGPEEATRLLEAAGEVEKLNLTVDLKTAAMVLVENSDRVQEMTQAPVNPVPRAQIKHDPETEEDLEDESLEEYLITMFPEMDL